MGLIPSFHLFDVLSYAEGKNCFSIVMTDVKKEK